MFVCMSSIFLKKFQMQYYQGQASSYRIFRVRGVVDYRDAPKINFELVIVQKNHIMIVSLKTPRLRTAKVSATERRLLV